MIALYIWLGIYVTEDFSSKNSRQVQQEKIWKDGPLAAVPGVPGKLHMHINMKIHNCIEICYSNVPNNENQYQTQDLQIKNLSHRNLLERSNPM